MHVLVLGGSGLISREIVRKLLEVDYEVTVYNRGNRSRDMADHVRQVIGDW